MCEKKKKKFQKYMGLGNKIINISDTILQKDL